MSDLTNWTEVTELTQGPFLAINLTNKRPRRREQNEILFLQNKTGDWPIPKAARNGGIEGKTVMLFYTNNGRSKIYTGKIKAETIVGKTKSGLPRYQLTVTRAWKTAGITTTTFSMFLDGFKLNSNPTCVWIDGSSYSPPLEDSDLNAGSNDDLESGVGGSNYMAWVAQRVGHTIFTKRVKIVWQNKCALTSLEAPRLVQACHIVPWSEANKAEKTCAHNGLMLCVHLHALFDSYLLGFDDDGTIMFADDLAPPLKKLVLSSGNSCLRKAPENEQIRFLERHRQTAKQKGKTLVRVTD